MFTAELFTIARTLKQPKCPSIEEWIKKMWYTHTHTQQKWNIIRPYKEIIMPLAATQMDLEITILSEVTQTEKNKYHITYMWNLIKNKLIYTTETNSQDLKIKLWL